MAEKFEWISEEEAGWEPLSSAQSLRRKRKGRRQLSLLLLLGVLAVTTYAGMRQVTGDAESNVRQNVLSSYDLWQRAVAEGDVDLFDSVISGSRPQWTVTQQDLFRRDLLIDRHPLGLSATDEAPTLVAVNSAPDLRAAEVILRQSYQGPVTDQGKPVVLERTLVFRLGKERWLWSPPLPEYWGAWRTLDGRFLSLTYPQRDEELAQRLHADMEAQLQTVCDNFQEFDCLPQVMVRVRLDIDPATLADSGNPSVMLRPAATLDLPAPSLVGNPIDEVGYQALRHGYTAPVVAVAISQAVGWTCCERGLFHQAFIDQWLDKLDLRPWPMTAADYDAMFYQATFGVKGLYHYWERPPLSLADSDGWREVYATVAYMLALNPQVPIETIHSQLLASEDVWSWLRRYQVDLRGFNDRAHRDWVRFAADMMQEADAEVALPAQDLQLLCQERRRPPMLFRFDLAANSWTRELESRTFHFMHPLASDDGVLLSERGFGPQRTAGVLWREGEAKELFSLPRTHHLFRVDVAKEKLQLYEYDLPEVEVSFSVLDLEQCENEDCGRTLIQGQPYWSPDHSRTLVETTEGELWHGDAQGRLRTRVGAAVAPFWLDNDTFGYVAGDSVQVTTVDGRLPEEIASVSDWSLQTGAGELEVRSIIPGLHMPDRLFVAAENEDEEVLILAHDLATGELVWSVDIQCGIGPYQPLLFSPDGRWLVTRSYAPCTYPWRLTIIDVVTGETQIVRSLNLVSFPGYDWSADGDWMVVVEDGYLQLLAPGHNYQRLIVHDFSDCSFAAWVN